MRSGCTHVERSRTRADDPNLDSSITLRDLRFGADISGGDVALNFVIVASGNLAGGFVFVTMPRTSQAIASGDTDAPTA